MAFCFSTPPLDAVTDAVYCAVKGRIVGDFVDFRKEVVAEIEGGAVVPVTLRLPGDLFGLYKTVLYRREVTELDVMYERYPPMYSEISYRHGSVSVIASTTDKQDRKVYVKVRVVMSYLDSL
jgi:hypothetical protein